MDNVTMLLLRLFPAGAELGGELFYGLSVLEVTVHHLWNPILVEAKIPGPRRVHDDVWAMLAQTQTVHAIDPDLAVQTGLPQLASKRLARLFCAAFLAVPTLADQHVGLVVPYLYLGQCPDCGL